MTASDTPEPTREELDRADRSLRDEQLSPTSRMTWHHLVHERATLTAARARIEELALINANLGIEHDKLRDLMEARGARIEQLEAQETASARAFADQGADLQRAQGRIEQLEWALRDLRQGCVVWAHDEDGVHNRCADAFNAASRLLGLRELVPDERYGTLVPAQPPAVAPEAESGPPTRDETEPPPGWEWDQVQNPNDGTWSNGHYCRRSPPELADLQRAWEYYDREHTPGNADSSEETP